MSNEPNEVNDGLDGSADEMNGQPEADVLPPPPTPDADNGDKDKGSSERLPRGAKPPKINLGEAVTILKDFYEKAGGEGSEDVLSEIMENSRSSSTFRIKIGNLRNYLLIENEEGKIKLSGTGNSIVAPKESTERMAALKKAFLGMEHFKTVYDKFSGRMLPQDEYLINSFVDIVPRSLANEWMVLFKESAIYAGLLIDRGENKYQVRSDIGTANTSEEHKAVDPEQANHSVEKPNYERQENLDSVNGQNNAIRKVLLKDAQKTIWIGTDANMFELRTGRDMNLVLALIKLFDLYEKGKDVDSVVSEYENKDAASSD